MPRKSPATRRKTRKPVSRKSVKKMAAKPRQRKVPIGKRTDWGDMKNEVEFLRQRLRSQPSDAFSQAGEPSSVYDVLRRYLFGEIRGKEAEEKIVALVDSKTRPLSELNREELETLIERCHLQLTNLPADDAQPGYKAPPDVLNAVIRGKLKVFEAMPYLAKMYAPPVNDRTDETQLVGEVHDRLARLRQLRGSDSGRPRLVSTLNTPLEILQNYICGNLTDKEFVTAINRYAGKPVMKRTDFDKIRRDMVGLRARIQSVTTQNLVLDDLPLANMLSLLLSCQVTTDQVVHELNRRINGE